MGSEVKGFCSSKGFQLKDAVPVTKQETLKFYIVKYHNFLRKHFEIHNNDFYQFLILWKLSSHLDVCVNGDLYMEMTCKNFFLIVNAYLKLIFPFLWLQIPPAAHLALLFSDCSWYISLWENIVILSIQNKCSTPTSSWVSNVYQTQLSPWLGLNLGKCIKLGKHFMS